MPLCKIIRKDLSLFLLQALIVWRTLVNIHADSVVMWQEVRRLIRTPPPEAGNAHFIFLPSPPNAGCLCPVFSVWEPGSGPLVPRVVFKHGARVSWVLCECHPDRQFFTFAFLLLCGAEEMCGHTEWHQEVLQEVQYEKTQSFNHCVQSLF